MFPSQGQVWRPRAAPLLPQVPDLQEEVQPDKAAPEDPVLAGPVHAVSLAQWKAPITDAGSTTAGLTWFM